MAKQRPPIKPASRKEFREALAKFAEEQKADIEMVEREQLRLMMRDAMTFSPPMPKGGGHGLGAAAHKAGMNRLGNDVRRIFIPQDKPVKGRTVFLRQVINSVKGEDRQTFFELHQNVTASKMNGLSPIMQKIMSDSDWVRALAKAKNYLNKTSVFTSSKVAGLATDFRPIHDRAKGAVGGRWPKGQKYQGPQYFASSEVILMAYISERQQKVGWVKAGYADALAKIPMPVNSKGIARNYGAYDAPWVDANKAGYGFCSVTKTSGGSAVAMKAGSEIGNINGVADESDVKNVVYGNRVQNIMDTVRRRQEDLIKRTNKRKK